MSEKIVILPKDDAWKFTRLSYLDPFGIVSKVIGKVGTIVGVIPIPEGEESSSEHITNFAENNRYDVSSKSDNSKKLKF